MPAIFAGRTGDEVASGLFFSFPFSVSFVGAGGRRGGRRGRGLAALTANTHTTAVARASTHMRGTQQERVVGVGVRREGGS